VYQLRFWDGERDAQAGCPGFKLFEKLLESVDIARVGEGCHSDGEIVNILDHQSLGDSEV